MFGLLHSFGGAGGVPVVGESLGVAVDTAGNSYFAGSFTGATGTSLAFNALNLAAAGAGVEVGFVVKLNAAGDVTWATR